MYVASRRANPGGFGARDRKVSAGDQAHVPLQAAALQNENMRGRAVIVPIDVQTVGTAQEVPTAIVDKHAVTKRERLLQKLPARKPISWANHLYSH